MGNSKNSNRLTLCGLPPWAICILAFILLLASIIVLKSFWPDVYLLSDSFPCVNLSEDELQQAYLMAVKDAEKAEPSEISRRLTPIVDHNPDLIWQGKRGESRLLVVTLTAPDKYDDKVPDQIAKGDVWVTVVPELRNYCKELNLSSEKLTLRLKQLLGLSHKTIKTDMVEIWTDPADLFRPSPDPEITDREAELDFPRSGNFLTVGCDHRRWFNRKRDRSYSIGNHPYPWTRLGYTYDWCNPQSEIGLSEFVIKKGAQIQIHSVAKVGDYCN
jgi:hypothetical protein